jgi:hypothetical protein
MAMVYTLLDSAKEWLTEKYGQNAGDGESEEIEEPAEEVFSAYPIVFFLCSLLLICINWFQPVAELC